MLAMVANDNAGCLTPRGVWPTIASMLAPTKISGERQKIPCLIDIS